MKPGKIVPVIALALMLAACGEPAADTTTVPSEEGSGVTVHWDMLTPKPENIANRRYEGYTDQLIPADDYGLLVPYIGGEASNEYWNQSWFYGLATRDGEIVTDPVYTEVEALGWYDYSSLTMSYEDVLILRSAVPSDKEPSSPDEWVPKFEDRYGLAAMDGSWYTGQIYTNLVCESPLGALLFDTDGDVVMIDTGGSELFRWEADAIPLEGLVATGIYDWGGVNTAGHYMEYVVSWDGGGEPDTRYVDLRDGTVYVDRPADYEDNMVGYDETTDMYRFSGGWYRAANGEALLEFDSGETKRFDLPDGFSGLGGLAVDGDRIIASADEGGGCVMLDLDGNELLRTDAYLNWLSPMYGDTPSLCATTDYLAYDDKENVHAIWHVYDRDGNDFFTADGNVIQWDEQLVIADETSYRLTDLSGNNLIRISRWENMDIPAEE